MNIPKSIKIGGAVYTVEITDRLDLGKVNYSGKRTAKYGVPTRHACRVGKGGAAEWTRPAACRRDEGYGACDDALHELLHGIADFMGYSDHDEKRIDELAHALHMVITDNPELFAAKREAGGPEWVKEEGET